LSYSTFVMAGHRAGHPSTRQARCSWVAGTSPAMTRF